MVMEAHWGPHPGMLLKSSSIRSVRTGSAPGQSCFLHEALGAARWERLGAAPAELCAFSREAEPESSLCFPPEDACGDGELDLSGIDDLEIDRVGAACSWGARAGWPGRGPGLHPWGARGPGLHLHVPGPRPAGGWAPRRLPGSARPRAAGSLSPDLSPVASGLRPPLVLQLVSWPSAQLLLCDP